MKKIIQNQIKRNKKRSSHKVKWEIELRSHYRRHHHKN